MTNTAPHGAWQSPLSAEDVARAGGEPRWLMEQWVTVVDDAVWWAELRPTEGGRSAVVRWTPDGGTEEMLPTGWNARNRLHEMGSRPFAVDADGERFVFTNWDDHRLYLKEPGSDPAPLTPLPEVPASLRYSDAIFHGDEVWCLREAITGPRGTDTWRELIAVPLDGSGDVRVLAHSHRFMHGPRVSPDGRHLAWLGWDHPAMPWDGTELCVATVNENGVVGSHRVLAGGPKEAICQLWWTGDDALTVLSDPDGWWNPYRVGLDGTQTPLWTGEQEMGGPLWRPGLSWGAPLADGRIGLISVAWRERDGRQINAAGLVVLDPATGELTRIDSPHTAWAGLAASGTTFAAVAAGPDDQPTVVRVDADSGEITPLTPPRYTPLPPEWRPQSWHRRFPAEDGSDIHAVVYLPRNPDYAAPEGELPPLLVTVHGGPTGRAIDALDPEITFFTSRGIAVVQVNHGGSVGLGRAYRERLRGQWGVIDVQDCVIVATTLADEGLVDRDRLVIRGGSAGGWTTCQSLTTVDTYRCGTSYYPVVDPLGWATGDTHDLESHYLYSMLGPLPEAEPLYHERSPIANAHRLTAPLLMLEGEEDVICPPEPCERMMAAIKGRDILHAYLTFPGEQHVFRRSESVRRALESELSFYGQILGFDPVGVPRLELTT
ncbi:prolyl oligopeptidase family serine peptidase [Kutzneria chonburiensis]|uniref:Prolyl oligopeptidase family serine peptidase n=1 Tax=Kutzneria chonburiensis TaxID=1483604 RepID=A0ABV6MK08_9PSEU